MFGMTRGEIGLVLIVFAMIYVATSLPKVVALISGGTTRSAGSLRDPPPSAGGPSRS